MPALTAERTILGTLQCTPEQVEGREADARSDIFALGAVLYEMVSGTRAFQGNSPASVITAIMSSEPKPLVEVAPLVPAALDRVLARCLAKNPEERWQSANDLAFELRSLLEPRAGAVAVNVAKPNLAYCGSRPSPPRLASGSRPARCCSGRTSRWRAIRSR